MTDIYAHWRYRLKHGTADGSPVLPTMYGGTPEDPQPGMYRTRLSKNGPIVPVQIWLTDENGNAVAEWKDGLKLAGAINREPATEKQIAERWIWLEPIRKDAFTHYVEKGHWPDDIPTIGDNSGDLTPMAELLDVIEQGSTWIKDREITDEVTAHQAGNYVGKISALRLTVDKEREAKVRPHLDAQNQINGEYNPIVKAAKDLEIQIKRAMDGFAASEKRRREAEARAKYEAEQKRINEERAKQEAERAEYLKANPIAEFTDPEPELPIAAPPPEPVKVALGGAHGKRITLRQVTEYVLVDYDAVVQALKNNPKVIEVITSVAKAQAKAGVHVPGVEARQVERVT